MVRDGDTFLLFYSANWYESPDYAIGYARCDAPTGPCKKMTLTSPFMKSSDKALGPGGQEHFTDGTGNSWLAYHAWKPSQTTYAAGGARSLRLARLSVTAGVPALVPTMVAATAPAPAPLPSSLPSPSPTPPPKREIGTPFTTTLSP